MKASILHDEHGRILSISKAVDLKASGSKFTSFGIDAGRGAADGGSGAERGRREAAAARVARGVSRGYGGAKAREEGALKTGEGGTCNGFTVGQQQSGARRFGRVVFRKAEL